MMTNSCLCLEDREEARAIAKSKGRGYLVTRVNLYHDTMPKSPDAIVWPNPPMTPDWTDEMLDMAIEGGYMLCGNPEEVCEQVARYQEVGCDQVVFGLPVEGMSHEQHLEMIELFGDHVIPEYDRDRTHSTDHYRATAERCFPDFQYPVPEGIDVEILPTTALLPLA
jgi:alkanesulfonate monooxygenase SsuD/methylene tetrahydromethanopterin reductase-like flavin-dependent oxidoreductase (luciferase family)